jgi:hypothetical protein
MAITAGTIVRTAVVLGAVGYCAWPGDAASGPAQAAKLPAVSTAILSPAIQPPPKRNPFRVAGAAPITPAVTGAAVSRSTSRSSPSDFKGKRADHATADPIAGLFLNATSICGNERIAMINGHLYQPGASLAGSEHSAAPLVVQQILPYKVLLWSEGRVMELGYADRVRRTESARQGGAPQRASRSPSIPSGNPAGKTVPGEAPAVPSNRNRVGPSQPAGSRHD